MNRINFGMSGTERKRIVRARRAAAKIARGLCRIETCPNPLDPAHASLCDTHARRENEAPTGGFPAWYADAPCIGHTRLFFAAPSESPDARHRREKAALRLCSACPHQQPCRTLGRDGREFGIWGAETEENRARAGRAPMLAHGTVATIRKRIESAGGTRP